MSNIVAIARNHHKNFRNLSIFMHLHVYINFQCQPFFSSWSCILRNCTLVLCVGLLSTNDKHTCSFHSAFIGFDITQVLSWKLEQSLHRLSWTYALWALKNLKNLYISLHRPREVRLLKVGAYHLS